MDAPPTFRLLRYFSLASLASIIVVAVALGILYREIAVRSLIAMGEANNTALTQVVANSMWPALQPYLAEAETMSPAELREHARGTTVAQTLTAHLVGLSVAKVKLYDLNGRTVFSTEARQIGENKSDNAGFLRARQGGIASELSHRHQFSAFDRVIVDRDLLSTYLPLRRGPDEAIVAVFEVYDDVTPSLERIASTQRIVMLGVLVILCLLYGVLFVIVRHADSIIRRQHAKRLAAEGALREAQSQLELRVAGRTLDLAQAIAGLEAEIAERHIAERRIAHMAHHDALTGLPNRTLLADRVGQALARAHRHGGHVALLFLDLDRFKNVNDSLGHGVGDLLLKAVAARICALLREDDTVARLGGDEFLISLPDLSDASEAAKVAARILDDLAQPFQIDGHDLHAHASIGIALYPADGDTVEKLMGNADTAMYHAKELGRGNYQFFRPPMTDRVHLRLTTETRLRHALEHAEFSLDFQPVLCLATERVESAEALLRWPQGGHMMSPTDFIPVAEDTGLIVSLGEWVLWEACSRAQAWQERHPGVRVAVNLSARQFRQKDMVAMIEGVLQDTGLAPSLLELELTESILMNNVEESILTLMQLHRMGVRLAIDDFGTGYSSLSYLKRFPLHTLKVDRSFVRDVNTDPDDAAIVTAIVAMSKSLGLTVTAEGVETEGQAAFLRSLGCDFVQGFHFARPMPAMDLLRWLDLAKPQRLVAIA